MKNQTFEEFLEQLFIDLGEVGGIAITKDNYEDMFDNWLSNKDIEDIIRLGNLYGAGQFLAGKEEILIK